MKKIDKLTPTMLRAIDMYCTNPGLSIPDIAKQLGKHYNTVWNWFDSPVFKEEIDSRFKSMWKEAAKEAQNKMYDLMRNAKDDVSFRATQYILDCNGFKPKDQIEVSGNMDIEINIINDKA